MSSFTKTTVYLPEADRRRLKELALRVGRPAAELIREAVAEYSRRRGAARLLPRSLGAGRSGRGDASERAEEMLGGWALVRPR